MSYPFSYVGDWTDEERKEARDARLAELTEHWEDILRDGPDPDRQCIYCGDPIPKKGKRGPRRFYCSARCKVGAARARDEALSVAGDWMPAVSREDLARYEEADRVDYVDAFPGDHPRLNAPVKPEWEVIGQFD